MVRGSGELPREIALTRRATASQSDGEGKDQTDHSEGRNGQDDGADRTANLRAHQQEQDHGAEKNGARFFGEDGKAKGAGRAGQPFPSICHHKASEEPEGQSDAEHGRTVEQQLSGHDDVVRHDGEDECGDQPRLGSVEVAADQIHHSHSCHADEGHNHSSTEVWGTGCKKRRNQQLKEQWMRPEHRKLVGEERIPSQRGGLAGIHGLIAIEAERVEIDHSLCESEYQDRGEPDSGRNGAPRERTVQLSPKRLIPAAVVAFVPLSRARSRPDGSFVP